MATRCFWPPESSCGYAVAVVGQPDAIQQSHGALVGGRLIEPEHAARGFHHVFQRRQVREQLEILKDHAEQPPHLAGLAASMMAAIRQQRVRADADFACVERVQPVDRAQQRRFARPAGADQRHGLAGVDRQADVVEHQPRAEAFGDVGR